MRHFELIAEGLNVAPVMAQLEENPDLWNEHRIRKEAPGTPHSEMSDIWVRYKDVKPHIEAGSYAGFGDPHIPIWYRAWTQIPALKPIVFNLMEHVHGEMLGGVLITKIPPGCGIDLHKDDNWHVQYFDKFYVSLQGAPGAIFGCEHGGIREELEPRTGDCWLFDNRKPHWVMNDSKVDRVTMIVCIRTEMFGRHLEC